MREPFLDGYIEFGGGSDGEGYPWRMPLDILQSISDIDNRLEWFHHWPERLPIKRNFLQK
jgi:hypothetical protein